MCVGKEMYASRRGQRHALCGMKERPRLVATQRECSTDAQQGAHALWYTGPMFRRAPRQGSQAASSPVSVSKLAGFADPAATRAIATPGTCDSLDRNLARRSNPSACLRQSNLRKRLVNWSKPAGDQVGPEARGGQHQTRCGSSTAKIRDRPCSAAHPCSAIVRASSQQRF